MKRTLVVVVFQSALAMEGWCNDGMTIPQEFPIASTKVKLALNCPPAHRRTYTLDGDGSFAFVETARHELEPHRADTREVNTQVEIDLVGLVVTQILDSSFPYLPERVGDRVYIVDDGVIGSMDVSVSSGCKADLTLRIGSLVKSVSYLGTELLPAGLVQRLQALSGESNVE